MFERKSVDPMTKSPCSRLDLNDCGGYGSLPWRGSLLAAWLEVGASLTEHQAGLCLFSLG